MLRLLNRDPKKRIEAYKQRLNFLSALYGPDQHLVHDKIEEELLGLVEQRQAREKARHQKKEIVEKRQEEERHFLDEELSPNEMMGEKREYVPPRDSLFFWDQIQSGLFF